MGEGRDAMHHHHARYDQALDLCQYVEVDHGRQAEGYCRHRYFNGRVKLDWSRNILDRGYAVSSAA